MNLTNLLIYVKDTHPQNETSLLKSQSPLILHPTPPPNQPTIRQPTPPYPVWDILTLIYNDMKIYKKKLCLTHSPETHPNPWVSFCELHRSFEKIPKWTVCGCVYWWDKYGFTAMLNFSSITGPFSTPVLLAESCSIESGVEMVCVNSVPFCPATVNLVLVKFYTTVVKLWLSARPLLLACHEASLIFMR